ncbi:MAG: FG-GAP-like repeat-containing protein [Thermoanaerobaculia bacterium]
MSHRPLALLGLWLLSGACAGLGSPAETPAAAEDRFREAARLRGEALAAIEDGAYAEALPLLDRLEELLPDNVLPPVDRAVCLFQLGRSTEALAAVDRALELAPHNPQVLFDAARIVAAAGEEERLTALLDDFETAHPHDPRPFYLKAERLQDSGRASEAHAALDQAVRRAPGNLVLLTDRLVAAADAGDAEAVADSVDALEDRLNGFSGNLEDFARTLRRAALGDDLGEAAPAARVVRNLLRPTDLYRQGLLEVAGGRAPGIGVFPQLDFEPPLPRSVQGGRDIAVALQDGGVVATGVSALARVTDATQSDAVWLSSATATVSWPEEAGRGALEDGGIDVLGFDLDQDAIPDLTLLEPSRGLVFHRGIEGGGFEPGRSLYVPDPALSGVRPVDVDHDGDLDLLLLRRGASDLYLENRGGDWVERAADLGVGGPARDSIDARSVDYDDDGDLDLLVAHGVEGLSALRNDRLGTLSPAADSWGLTGLPALDLEPADFDADGLVDLAVLTPTGIVVLLGRRGRPERARLEGLPAGEWSALAVADLDNDADSDLIVAGESGVWLLRNRNGGFSAERQEVEVPAPRELVAGDWDGDGDLDLLALAGDGTVHRWDNLGGDRNHWLRLRLRGLPDNNSKNNTAGLFTRIEVRVGGDVQLVFGNGAVNHLGLGSRREADVVRVVWTNGLGQTWSRVASRQTLVEEQVLKGSCPFLYTWDGDDFRFVTDLMWRSPLGMRLPDGSDAPHQSARDFVLIPGEALQPAAGSLWLQVTEELWEAAYVDRLRLLAVDHPEERELVVDERFTPPPHPTEPALHWVDRSLAPSRAVDHHGRDVRRELSDRDRVYVGDLPLDRYQGVTHEHSLELVFDDVPDGTRLRLLLTGWIFPTDSSINLALSQDASRDSVPPRLSVREEGAWRPLDLWVGFPDGKDKTVVVDLTGRVGGGRLELRLDTSMQIYWDSARLALGEPDGPRRATWLEPRDADLHYRGFSALTRASAESPHRFDYGRVSVGPRFRDMNGRFTRFGPVGELLTAEDDRYVVMNAGDEMTVRFDAESLPELPAGWRRDWVLYTDGWVKDADVNTRRSATVEPLPHHGMAAYPDPAGAFPDTPEHRAWLAAYQTRRGDGEPFSRALRPKVPER